MNAFTKLLDIELETQGWRERERHFDAMIEAARARDDAAFAEAKRKFDEATPRDAEQPKKRSATN